MTLFDTRLGRDEIVRETDRAVLFVAPGNGGGTQYSRPGRETWLPKSQITWKRASPVYAETAHVPGWLARKL